MIGYVLTFMLVAAIFLGALNGKTADISSAFTNGAAEAIKICITMAGMMALWSGIIRIAEKAGIVNVISKILRPVIRKLFPDVPSNSDCENAICLNVTANILGLGNAATPMGIKAMKGMQEINRKSYPSKSMQLFLVLNCASIQIIPATVAALRAANNSKSPFDILSSVWFTSAVTLICGLSAAYILIFITGGKKNGR